MDADCKCLGWAGVTTTRPKVICPRQFVQTTICPNDNTSKIVQTTIRKQNDLLESN